MARARNLKPGFFKNEELVDLGFGTMLLFAGLWTLADREGRLEDRPRRIKAEVFPHSPKVNIEKGLKSLALGHFIIRYDIGDKKYIAICNFSRHQNPHVKEPPSTIPAPCEHDAETILSGKKPGENSSGPASFLIPSSSVPIPATPHPQTRTRSVPGADSEPVEDAEFQRFWDLYPNQIERDLSYQMWLSVVDRQHPEEVFAGLGRWRKSHMWAVKKMYHKPVNWLSSRLWKDRPPQARDMREQTSLERTMEAISDAGS